MTNNAPQQISPAPDTQKPQFTDERQYDQVNFHSSEQLCPVCQEGRLDFDGCLNLICPVCGFTQTGGGFT
jgi:rubredoxin